METTDTMMEGGDERQKESSRYNPSVTKPVTRSCIICICVIFYEGSTWLGFVWGEERS